MVSMTETTTGSLMQRKNGRASIRKTHRYVIDPGSGEFRKLTVVKVDPNPKPEPTALGDLTNSPSRLEIRKKWPRKEPPLLAPTRSKAIEKQIEWASRKIEGASAEVLSRARAWGRKRHSHQLSGRQDWNPWYPGRCAAAFNYSDDPGHGLGQDSSGY